MLDWGSGLESLFSLGQGAGASLWESTIVKNLAEQRPRNLRQLSPQPQTAERGKEARLRTLRSSGVSGEQDRPGLSRALWPGGVQQRKQTTEGTALEKDCLQRSAHSLP